MSTPRDRKRGSAASRRRRPADVEDITPYQAPEADAGDGHEDADLELQRAHRLVGVVRGALIVMVVLLALLGLVGATQKSGMLLALQLTVPAFLFLAWQFLRGQPFAWTTACALVLTLLAVGNGVLASYIPAGSLAGKIVWGVVTFYGFLALAAWVATYLLFGVKRTLREHPDTFFAQRFQGSNRRYRDAKAGMERLARGFAEYQSTSKKMLVAGIGTVVAVWVIAIGSIFWSASIEKNKRVAAREAAEASYRREQQTREKNKQDFRSVQEGFERAWAGSDRKSIEAMIMVGHKKKQMTRLATTLERYDFEPDGALPGIDNARARWAGAKSVKIYWSIPSSVNHAQRSKLRTEWQLYEGEWYLLEIGLKKTNRD